MGDLLTLKHCVFLAGLLHFCQLPAMVAASRILNWDADLSKLQPINLRSVKVIGLAIVMTVVGLGIVVMISPGEVAGGSRLGTSLAGFLTIFWIYRGSVNVVLYGKIWPAGFRWGYYALNLLFVYLVLAYLAAFIKGVSG